MFTEAVSGDVHEITQEFLQGKISILVKDADHMNTTAKSTSAVISLV